MYYGGVRKVWFESNFLLWSAGFNVGAMAKKRFREQGFSCHQPYFSDKRYAKKQIRRLLKHENHNQSSPQNRSKQKELVISSYGQ